MYIQAMRGLISNLFITSCTKYALCTYNLKKCLVLYKRDAMLKCFYKNENHKKDSLFVCCVRVRLDMFIVDDVKYASLLCRYLEFVDLVASILICQNTQSNSFK